MEFNEAKAKRTHECDDSSLQAKLVMEASFIGQTTINGLDASREELTKACANGSIVPQFAQTAAIGAGLAWMANSRLKLVGQGLAAVMGTQFVMDIAKSAGEVFGKGIDTWNNPENYQSNLKAASASAGHFIYENALGALGVPTGAVLGHAASKIHFNGFGHGQLKPAHVTASAKYESGAKIAQSHSVDYSMGHPDTSQSHSRDPLEFIEAELPALYDLRTQDGKLLFSGNFFSLREALETAVKANRSLRGVDLSHSDIRGVNLSGATIEGAKFFCAQAEGANFSGAIANGADFCRMHADGANFSGMEAACAQFSEMQAAMANFNSIKAEGADFSGMQAKGAFFMSAHVEGANFSGAHANEVDFGHTKADRVNFSDTKAEKTSFKSMQAKNAIFSGMQAPKADFTDIKADGAQFKGMNATGATFLQASVLGADFSSMQAEGARFTLMKAAEANFRGIQAKGAIFSGMRAEHADFTGANFENANFSNVRAKEANFTDANLDNADVSGTDFKKGNLSGVRIEDIKGLELAEFDVSQIDGDVNGSPVDWRPTETVPEDYYAL